MIGSRDARSLVYPILLILLVAAAAAPAHAVDGDVAPMLGLRFLGEFDVDGASDQTLDPALSFGVMVDFGIFKQGNLHLLLSHQESSLDGEDEDEDIKGDVGIVIVNQLGWRVVVVSGGNFVGWLADHHDLTY